MARDLIPGKRVIDRRSFIQKSALLAASSTFAPALIACGDIEYVYIPCLGPAAAPVPVPGMTYIRASEIGCALDCKLETGRNKFTGGAATDDGPRINAAMANASAANPITLIIDGSALVSGLFLPAGGYWSIAGLGCGTGFFIKSGTNNDGIHNGPPNAAIPSDPGPPAPPRGKNVSLSNFALSGNQGDGHNGVSTTGTRQGTSTTWYFGINLMNLDNVTIENVVVVNTPAYHIRFSNVGNVAVSGCVMASQGGNTDGLHFDGPANDITISDCDFTTHDDDPIGLNCPEGYSGNISRVAVTNCTFNTCPTLMRLYTTDGSPNKRFSIDTVSVANCTGTIRETAFMIGLSPGSIPNSVTSLTVTDCSLIAPNILGMVENFGNITLRNLNFYPSSAEVIWAQTQSNHDLAILRPSPSYGPSTYVGSSLTLENCVIHRNGYMNVPAVVLQKGSIVNNLEINGLTVSDSGPFSRVPALLDLELSSIGQLVLGSVDTSNIAALVSAGGFSSLGSVSGEGVLATNWKFPDSVMANEVPYISAATGLPSIKVGGVVQPYP